MSTRARVALIPPPADPPALSAFPSYTIDPSDLLYRVTRAGRGPWWFSSDGSGRFDLPPPAGTCYLAEDPLTALLEVIGGGVGVVPAGFVAARRLRALRLPRPVVAADAIARRAARWVTRELSTLVPYDLPRAWARQLAAAGFGGLRAWSRYDPDPRGRTVALFGGAGERQGWRRGRERPIDAVLIHRLARECGIVVKERPAWAEVTIVEPPGDAP